MPRVVRRARARQTARARRGGGRVQSGIGSSRDTTATTTAFSPRRRYVDVHGFEIRCRRKRSSSHCGLRGGRPVSKSQPSNGTFDGRNARVRQQLCASPGALLRAGRSHEGRRPAGREDQPAAGGAARRQPGAARVQRRSVRSWPATRSRRARSRSRSRTPAISSAGSSRSWATVGRSCWARSSAPTGGGATSSSRDPGARRSRAAATDAPPSAPCCASTWSARRWRRSAFPPRARSRS